MIKKVALKDGATDTDGDGLTDSEEMNWDCLIGKNEVYLTVKEFSELYAGQDLGIT